MFTAGREPPTCTAELSGPTCLFGQMLGGGLRAAQLLLSERRFSCWGGGGHVIPASPPGLVCPKRSRSSQLFPAFSPAKNNTSDSAQGK